MESPTNVGRVQTEIDISEEEEMLPSPVAHDDVSRMARDLKRDAYRVSDYLEILPETATMRRIPTKVVRTSDGGDFEPKLISIGPYHSKKEALLPMQDVKLQYLRDLLDRSVEINKIKKYMEAIEEQLLTEEVKYYEFYACGISKEDFLKMLVLDGCFLVEFLLKHGEGLLTPPGVDIHLLNHDLVLIENQVPFSVLKVIYQLTDYPHTNLVGPQKRCSLFDLAIFYLDNREKNGAYKEEEDVDHLLHLLYLCRLDQLKRMKPRQRSISTRFYDLMLGDRKRLFDPSNVLPVVLFILAILFLNPLKKIFKYVSKAFVGLVYIVITGVESSFTLRNKAADSNHDDQKWSEESPLMETVIPTVKELNYAGMWFDTRYSRPYLMFYYTGDESMNGGSMEINDNFFTEFDNMLFYEHFILSLRSKEGPRYLYISSYAVYMRNLVKTEIDIDVLRRHGILKTAMTSHKDKQIASFFGKYRSWLVLPKSQQDHIREDFKSINQYFNRGHNKRRAKLMKEYFKSSLVIFSFSGFIMLSILTVTQTVFTLPN